MRILIIEDSVKLQRSLITGLKNSGYNVEATGDGEEGLWHIESFKYDLVILDLMLPGIDGISILKKVREKKINTNILILSAKDEIEDRVNGLNLGADDYLVKPFAFEELLARIKTIIRRSKSIKSNIFEINGLCIDIDKKIVKCNGSNISMPPREYSVLEYLILNRGRVVSRNEIEEQIYDMNSSLMSNSVDAAICNIRKLIDKDSKNSIISTRRGKGFIIED